jgi:uncharacterized protein
MFGFSLPKLLVLIVILLAVWYGFKWVARLNQVREASKKERRRLDAGTPGPDTEDMVKCARCDTFVPARGARHCGRDGCPYPR